MFQSKIAINLSSSHSPFLTPVIKKHFFPEYVWETLWLLSETLWKKRIALKSHKTYNYKWKEKIKKSNESEVRSFFSSFRTGMVNRHLGVFSLSLAYKEAPQGMQ